jgi:S1-C subfamily serine protease
MRNPSKSYALAITAVSLAVILVTAFTWAGPGLQGITTPAAAALFDEEQVQRIYEDVSPAVVAVHVDRRVGGSLVQVGVASGFLLDREGHIATNNHVVEDADRVRVDFANGMNAEATVLGRNPANDLAVIKVDAAKAAGIEPVRLGNSAVVRPGQMAIAIGNPFGLDGSVTAGIISGVNRDLPSDLGRSIPGVLQTDALINPGSSGGPLLNSSGQVVGINTAIQINPIETATVVQLGRRNIGFAVPVNSLRDLLPRLKEARVVQPAWMGISATAVDARLAEVLKELPVERGVYVLGMAPNSPAAQASLVPSGVDAQRRPKAGGDIILAIEGKDVKNVADLVSILNRHLPGEQISLTVLRNGERIQVPLTLGEWPEMAARSGPAPELPAQPDEWQLPEKPETPLIPGLPLPDLFPDHPRR